jgi:putative oxidoreductase
MSGFGPTVLRVVLGVIFVLHGYLGLFVLEPAGAAAFTTVMGLPAGKVLAWYLILAHVVGGLMMIVGLWTRWAALANIPVMLVAMLFLIDQGFFMKAVVADAAAGQARVVGIEYPLLVLAATLSLVLLGGGALAMTSDDRSQ